jgi:tape measure domain-containing protein
MPIEVEQLIATLEARIDKYEKNLAKAYGTTDRQFKAIETRGKKLEATFARSGENAALNFTRGLAGPLAALASLKGLQDLIDEATRIHNALTVAGLSGTELTKVYEALFRSAQANAAPLESLVTLYGRASIVSKELGANTEDLLKFTDNVGKALRVGGVSAEQASGALLQLSQALGSGTVRAEEFNSVQEGALPILKAAANGIKEAGGSVSKLRQLVIAGKVSSEALFRGFLAGSQILDDRLAGSVLTVDQAFTTLHNSLVDAAGRLNDITGASQTAVAYLKGLGDYVSSLAKLFEAAASNSSIGAFIEKLQTIANIISTIQQYAPASLNPLGAIPSTKDINDLTDYVSGKNDPPTDRGALQAQLDQLRQFAASNPTANTDEIRQEVNDILGKLYGTHDTRLPLDPTKIPAGGISLSDFPTTSSKTKKSGSTKKDDYEQALKTTNEETAALNEQRAALAGLSGSSADYAQKVTAVEQATSILSAAQKAGAAVGKELSDVNQLLYGDLSKLTPEAQKQALAIRAAALSYADADAKLNKLKETQDAAAQSLKDMIQLEKDVAGGILSDIRTALEDGKITWKEWGNIAVNALNKVADKLQETLLDQLFKANPFSFLGSLGGAVSGGSVGGGVAAAGAKSAPALRAPHMPAASAVASAKSEQSHIVISVDDAGAIQAYVAKEGRRTKIDVLNASKASLDQYRRGKFHRDWEGHAGQRRVTGKAG